ncbi:MAG: flotillin-like FloA family protein [Anaerococcus sp.]|nr:flotillin-like FloA family protein [Anaerococcus sp.]
MPIIIPALIVILVVVFLSLVPIGLWITARSSGVPVSMGSLVAMRFRRVNPRHIVYALIKSHQAGIQIASSDLESHFLSGGDVNQVVDALIAAERANIERLVGGAGEETIIARVGEGIVTTVGSSHTHAEVLENPDNISQTVLEKGLDSGTAFEILSIDIADVDVGRNVGAELQRDQAEADKNIAQAKAEERRAQAIALEQENRAKVVDAQSKVPLAIAKALESGNLGVLDYYNMKNINADTQMRNKISEADSRDEF